MKYQTNLIRIYVILYIHPASRSFNKCNSSLGKHQQRNYARTTIKCSHSSYICTREHRFFKCIPNTSITRLCELLRCTWSRFTISTVLTSGTISLEKSAQTSQSRISEHLHLQSKEILECGETLWRKLTAKEIYLKFICATYDRNHNVPEKFTPDTTINGHLDN